MQSMWAGTLAFGPVDIPVRLSPATRPRELAFRQVHAEDGGRITFRRSCTACGAEVPYASVAKAYQRPDGGLVPLTDEDLASLPLEASHRVDVLGFTLPGTIDPLLVSRSYFLTPDTPQAPRSPTPPPTPQAPHTPEAFHSAADSYALVHAALELTGRVAVARITLRQRETRAAIWPRGQSLVLQTLLTPDEIADPSADTALSDSVGPAQEAGPAQEPAQEPDRESALAELARHIMAMTRDFDPAAHRDGYRDQLEALIRHRARSPHPR